MRWSRHQSRLLAIGALPIVAVAFVSLADATDCGHSATLPTTDPIGCANCHRTATPGGQDLNPFGQDFANGGHVWNSTLALRDSDADDCSNGFELGDSNGDGVLDGYITQQNSNPGVADCSGGALTEPRTWGDLKALFQR